MLSDDELGFADLASPVTIENLRHNPAIELNVVDPFTRRGFRFKGAAKVMKDPEAHGRFEPLWRNTSACFLDWMSMASSPASPTMLAFDFRATNRSPARNG